MKVLGFVKNWMLPIAMAAGVAAYYIYVNIPALDGTHEWVNRAISYVQPALLFCMLFVSFCRMSIRELKPRAWMLELLAIQVVSFVAMGLLIVCMPDVAGRVVIESAMTQRHITTIRPHCSMTTADMPDIGKGVPLAHLTVGGGMVCASSVPKVSCLHSSTDESGVQSVGCFIGIGDRRVSKSLGA